MPSPHVQAGAVSAASAVRRGTEERLELAEVLSFHCVESIGAGDIWWGGVCVCPPLFCPGHSCLHAHTSGVLNIVSSSLIGSPSACAYLSPVFFVACVWVRVCGT